MNIFGFNIPLWLLLSIAFALLYFIFSVLDSVKKNKALKKRKNSEGDVK